MAGADFGSRGSLAAGHHLNQGDSMKITPFRLVLAAIVLFFVTFLTIANASEGTGTAGFCARHGCGEPTDPRVVLECPDLVCPNVTCGETDCSKTTVIVTPTPVTCPTLPVVVFPNYYPCRKKADGTYICPRRKTPHRVLVPETTAGKQ